MNSKIWGRNYFLQGTSNMEPDSGLRTLETLNKFKKEIKSWKCDASPCRMCKTYIQRVGFIN